MALATSSDLTEEYVAQLIQHTYITPATNQSELVVRWHEAESRSSLPSVLLSLAANRAKYPTVLRTSALAALKSLAERVSVPLPAISPLLGVAFSETEPAARKLCGNVLATWVHRANEAEAQELLSGFLLLLKQKGAPPELLGACADMLEDMVDSDRTKANTAGPLAETVSLGIVNGGGSTALPQLIRAFGSCLFSHPVLTFPFQAAVIPVRVSARLSRPWRNWRSSARSPQFGKKHTGCWKSCMTRRGKSCGSRSPSWQWPSDSRTLTTPCSYLPASSCSMCWRKARNRETKPRGLESILGGIYNLCYRAE